jgi:hypothetical protein
MLIFDWRFWRFFQVNGSTPIMVACKEGKYALVEKLLERGAPLSDTDMVCIRSFISKLLATLFGHSSASVKWEWKLRSESLHESCWKLRSESLHESWWKLRSESLHESWWELRSESLHESWWKLRSESLHESCWELRSESLHESWWKLRSESLHESWWKFRSESLHESW